MCYLFCRAAFVAPSGYVLLSADYAQLELRLMAHLSEDASLCQLLRDPSHDPFFHLAVRWLQLRPEQVGFSGRPCLQVM